MSIPNHQRQSALKKTLILLLLCFMSVSGLQARLRFIGPNPYYSFLTFPQDSQLFKSKASLAFLYYKNRGWMGHLDVPEESPSPQYIATEESVQENFHDQEVADAGFKGMWLTPEILTVPFILDYKSLRIIPMVSGQMDFFNLKASGEAIAHDENSQSLIPFISELRQQNSQMSFGLLASTKIKKTPIGFILRYTQHRENSPRGYLRFNRNGSEISTNRFNWGWSTAAGCNHIFGTSTNIDAFWLDHYTDSKLSQLDLVIGTDIRDHKVGFRYRRSAELGDYYSYSDSQDEYVNGDWREKTTKTTYRAYDVFKLMTIGDSKLYLCSVIETDIIRSRDINAEVELLDSYRENVYAFELLPFFHFDLAGGGFLRIGSSASFFFNGYRYQDIWGDQKVYRQSWPRFGWERSWESSSYGNTFTFINFSEADMELPVFRRWNLLISVDLWSHQVYSKTKRYYGQNQKQEGAYNFHRVAERKNVLKESWFGGTFGVFFGKKLSLGLFMDLPVYYDQKISTEIKGEEGDYFHGLSDAQPSIRTPVGFWAMIIWRW